MFTSIQFCRIEKKRIMADEPESLQKSVSVAAGKNGSCTLYFVKDCDCGEIINERLLPNSISESNLTSLFAACIECLIFANTRLEANKFVKLVVRSVGNYSSTTIENRLQLRQMLDKLCKTCRICPNFINEENIKRCPLCDDSEGDEPGEKKVILHAFSSFSPFQPFFQLTLNNIFCLFLMIQTKVASQEFREFVFDNKKVRVALKRLDHSDGTENGNHNKAVASTSATAYGSETLNNLQKPSSSFQTHSNKVPT